MHIGSFEPTVMFFRMTNLPATFQAMMNEILRDLINEGKVTVYHKWSLTICDGCFDTSKSSKMRS